MTPELAKLKKLVQQLPRSASTTGPAFYDPVRDGVTFSILSQFRRCREMARLSLKGITSIGQSGSMVFGNIAHATLQTVYGANAVVKRPPNPNRVLAELRTVESLWKEDNPRADRDALESLEFTMILSEAIMPFYFQYWKDDFAKVKWIAAEKEFKLPIHVQSPHREGMKDIIPVRGKMDANFERGKDLWLFETKTKSQIEDDVIADMLPHELQVNLYMWAMRRIYKRDPKGVRYNLIRRPQLRIRKAETVAEFARRCVADVKARPDFYFIRLDMQVTHQDLVKFELEFQDLLEDFVGWWYGGPHYKNSDECRNKYGRCHFLPICGRKDYATFYRRDRVFRELEEM